MIQVNAHFTSMVINVTVILSVASCAAFDLYSGNDGLGWYYLLLFALSTSKTDD